MQVFNSGASLDVVGGKLIAFLAAKSQLRLPSRSLGQSSRDLHKDCRFFGFMLLYEILTRPCRRHNQTRLSRQQALCRGTAVEKATLDLLVSSSQFSLLVPTVSVFAPDIKFADRLIGPCL